MDKHVFFGVRAVDEAISALDVEPFHSPSDFGSDDLFAGLAGWLLFLGLTIGDFF